MESGRNDRTAIRFGEYELDLQNRELRRNGIGVDLQPQAFDVLALLASRPNTLVTRGEIQTKIWPSEPFSNIHSRLNFQIKNIRLALQDDSENPSYLQTVPKSGYKFIAAVKSPDVKPGLDQIQPALQSEALARRFRPRAVVLSILVVVLGIISAFVVTKARQRGVRLAKVTTNGSVLEAWDERGRLLWTHNFGQPLRESTDLWPTEIQIADFGRDGTDVLVLAPFYRDGQANSSSDALFSFSSEGKLRWRHNFDQVLTFGGKQYGGPWLSGALMVSRDNGDRRSIWAAFREELWSPSTLSELDRSGHLLGQYVNWGHIVTLGRVRSASGSYVLAGGINNECDCAMLAVLREDRPSGSSPSAEGSALTCDNCPQGRPYRYLLFPRSDLSWPSGTTYNQVRVILTDDAKIRVGVAETVSPTRPLSEIGPDWKIYDLTPDFVPQSVSVSDHYWLLHRQLEARGKIKHDVHQCPELLRPTVKMWDADNGWRNVSLPPVTAP